MSTTLGKFINKLSHSIENAKLTELIANQQRNIEKSVILKLQCNNETQNYLKAAFKTHSRFLFMSLQYTSATNDNNL